jgi:hypothetical protein
LQELFAGRVYISAFPSGQAEKDFHLLQPTYYIFIITILKIFSGNKMKFSNGIIYKKLFLNAIICYGKICCLLLVAGNPVHPLTFINGVMDLLGIK